MRSLVPVQMASRLVAGLTHIFMFRKLLKKLGLHSRKFRTEFFKPDVYKRHINNSYYIAWLGRLVGYSST